MKKWLRAQPDQPATIAELQALLDRLRRPLQPPPPAPLTAAPGDPGRRSTTRCPKRYPADHQTPTPTTGSATTASTRPASVTLRHNGRLHHIGIGRTHARTHVILLIADLDIRVVNATTGELLRHLTLDPTPHYQPTGAPKDPPNNPEMTTAGPQSQVRLFPMS